MKRSTAVCLASCLFAIATVGCSDDGTGPHNADPIALPVRVHLLSSSKTDPITTSLINTTITDEEVAVLFQGANEVWRQASITWEIESIVRDSTRNEDKFTSVSRGESPLDLLSSVVPDGRSLPKKWNVFIVRTLGDGVAGAYLPDVRAVILPEVDRTGARDLTVTGSGRRALAHELGHSLSLEHVPCPPEGNLMAPMCDALNRTLLTTIQILQARRVGFAGRPYGL
ncbi:MAG: hypothetical protein ACE5HT_15645 [Gemmatimonadales bacterium]